MSRSYKKSRYCKESHRPGVGPKLKRFANKKVRRFADFDVNGSAYKKIEESWGICDWKWYVKEDKDSEFLRGWNYLRRK